MIFQESRNLLSFLYTEDKIIISKVFLKIKFYTKIGLKSRSREKKRKEEKEKEEKV